MTNDQYIAALKKALSGMDGASRRDIIQEIQSHGAEADASLLERFGTPETLAAQYLEGEVVKIPVTKKVVGAGKKMFLWVGILASTILAALVFFIWTASTDDFNYADESSAELDKTSASWVTKPWAEGMSIEVEQSSAVFYWHDDPTVRWQCNGTQPLVNKDNKLNIRQSKCLIMLPKMAMKIVMDQAQIVLVRPQASLDLKIRQTNLRIAENETQYRYEVNANRSRFSDLSSVAEAEHTIQIEAIEATISAYEER